MCGFQDATLKAVMAVFLEAGALGFESVTPAFTHTNPGHRWNPVPPLWT